MCTLTWSLFPFPVLITWLLFRRPNGQRSTNENTRLIWHGVLLEIIVVLLEIIFLGPLMCITLTYPTPLPNPLGAMNAQILYGTRCTDCKISFDAIFYMLAQAALRAPPEVALQCVAGHCYYQLSVFFSLSPSFAFDPLRGISRGWKFVFPNILA